MPKQKCSDRAEQTSQKCKKVLRLVIYLYIFKPDPLNLAWEPVYEKENSGFNTVKIHLKIVSVLYPVVEDFVGQSETNAQKVFELTLLFIYGPKSRLQTRIKT